MTRPAPRPSTPNLSRRAALLGLAATATACAGPRDVPLAGPPRGRVVVLRGLGNMFSTGMDRLEVALRRDGYDAAAYNHTEWAAQADAAVELARKGELPRPFAVVGHSLGSDDGIRLAARVGQATGMMDVLVTFDPVMVRSVPRGPAVVRNYFQKSDIWGGAQLVPDSGFDGRLENRLVDGDNHFTIDKDPALHREVIALLEAARSAVAAPPVDMAA
jgi:pimeloyl-ACP methyl ester carboxylesterase